MSLTRIIRGQMPGLAGERDIRIIDGDTHISRWVEESGRLDHDQNTLPRIRKLIHPEDVVVDCGAFIGDHSAYYASLGAYVIAIEANPIAASCLNFNLAAYDAMPCWCAVGDVDDGRVGVAMEPNAGASHCSPGTSVPVRTLDSILRGRPVRLIKLDIEGWEPRALRGAERTLREHHPALVVEVNRGALERAGSSPGELHAILEAHGYQARDIFTDEPWLAGDPRPQFDVVAT